MIARLVDLFRDLLDLPVSRTEAWRLLREQAARTSPPRDEFEQYVREMEVEP